MKKLLLKSANNESSNSLSHRLRRKRFKYFLEFLEGFKKPVSILDVGGTYSFWKNMGINPDNIKLTICNIEEPYTQDVNVKFVKCDARKMICFKNCEFDIVFSNSVIEHAGNFDEQQKMANEIRRVGRAYFIQTPNYYFPFEPHFLFPFFHFLPIFTRIWLVRRFSLGWFKKAKNYGEAKELVQSINLLSRKQLDTLFPGSKIVKERFWGFTKSITAIKIK